MNANRPVARKPASDRPSGRDMLTTRLRKQVTTAGWESLSLDWIISYLRWPWLGVAFLMVWLNPDLAPGSLLPLCWIIGFAALHNLAHVAALYTHFHGPRARAAGIFLDVLVATATVLATGGWNSHLLPAVLFPVLAASISFGLLAGLAAVAPITVIYAASVAINRDLMHVHDLYLLGANLVVLAGAACVVSLLSHGSVPRTSGDAPPTSGTEELDRLRRANKRATVVREMATTLSATLSYARVLRTMLDLSLIAMNESDSVDTSLVGLVLLFEQEGNFEELRVRAGRNMPRVDEDRVLSGKSDMITRAVYGAEPCISEDARHDPVLAQLLCTREASSALCVPLRAGFDVFGVVVLASPQAGYFNTEHADLLSTFCHQAALALKNAQLYQNLQSEQRRILEKEAEARHKLARELHDGPTQSISAIVMRLNYARKMIEKNQPSDKVAEEVTKIEEMARMATQEVRMMLFTLRPVILETRGLVAALQQYADRLRQADNLNVQVDAQRYGGQIDTETEGVIFAVIEEAVGNAKKHARAKTVVIRLRVEDQLFWAEVQDDGIGFDAEPAHRRREAGHMGLLNMEDRTEYLGGSFSIESHPGAGTRVRMELPLQRWSAVG